MGTAYGENAIIVGDDGNNVRWYTRCPYCGRVNNMMTYGPQPIFSGSKRQVGTPTCSNCRKMFNVYIGRSF